MGGRIKVTGYYTPDDDIFDAGHSSGVSAEGWDQLTEEFMSLEDIELEAVED